jgi:CheY-like chemotaxis protein
MPTWIVVEDEPDLYKVVSALCGMMGVQSAGFASGEEVMTWIRQVDNNQYSGPLPQLALIDIRLPGAIDGVKVGARLRRSPVLGDIAIVLMTAFHLSPRYEHDALKKSGADTLLYKPLPNPAAFRAIADEALSRRRWAGD